MLLRSITLNNIRSYKEQTIHFQQGITLLAGDIGSGKSTILHSIEFALFGSSRPDLPSESLLRKGCSKASVTLDFSIDDQNYTIHRTLQSSKQGLRSQGQSEVKEIVKQGTGFIIQNGQKFEMTAIELKAKVLEILGYPKELITKNKNYVYRYTIYCPQEDMKQILLESDDSRLEILRKIFQVEKYKNVRENILIYLRTLRKEITVLSTRCENLDEREKEFLESAQHQSKSQEQEKILMEQVKVAKEVFEKEQILVEQLRKSHREKEQVINQLKVLTNLQKDLHARQDQLKKKIERLRGQRKSLLVDNSNTIEKITYEIETLMFKSEGIKQKKQEFDSSLKQLQNQIKELQVELNDARSFKERLEKLAEQIEVNKEQLDKKENLTKEKELLEMQQKEIFQIKTQIKTKIAQEQKRKERISSLTQCPTCEQEVSYAHCTTILAQINQEITSLGSNLQKKLLEESELQEKLLLFNSKLEEIQKLEIEQSKLTLEHATLQEKQRVALKLKDKLKEKVANNNAQMTEYQNFLNSEFPLQEDFQNRIKMLQKQKEQLQLVKQLKEQEQDLGQEQDLLIQRTQKQEIEIKSLQKRLEQLPETQEELLKLENSLETARNNLEGTKIDLSKQEQIVKFHKQTLNSLETELKQLRNTKKQLKQNEELVRWIDNKFIPLTWQVEKEIMLKIYHYCNDLFSEWFELLTEGSELSASLDSTFSPVIEQQGHQIAFSYLSGGERTAASLAYRLALTKAVNGVMHEIKTKELLILDEPTDGFSSDQLQRLRDCLETIGLKQIIVVSHEEMMEGFVNHIINVEKKGGVSYLC